MSTFKDLKDGSRFTVVTGDTTRVPVVYIKTEEDGGLHNATREDNSNQSIRLPETIEVEDLGMAENIIPFPTRKNEVATLVKELYEIKLNNLSVNDIGAISKTIAFLNKL